MGVKGDVGRVMDVVATGMMSVGVSGVGWCRCSVGVKGDIGRVMGVVATGMMGVG